MKQIIVDDGPEGLLSEKPAIEQLVKLGYEYLSGDEVAASSKERNTLKDVVFIDTLTQSLKRINPWINEENLRKVVRELTILPQNSLVEANQFIYNYLVRYTSVEQDLGKGKRSETVKVIDFDNVANNTFQVVNQIKYLGHKEPAIKPDIVLYVNGLPLAVIECKQPYISNPMEEAINQLRRYSNLRKPEDLEGCEKLFYYNQIMVSTCRDKALAGTISSPAGYYLSWHKYEDNFQGNHQEALIDALFKKENFLDIIRNFIVFDKEEGRIIKKIPRYQQYRAVNKAIDRLLNKKVKNERGGVVWHTQGSGKSLTMAFLATKIRHTKALADSKLVFIIDRTELQVQLKDTFRNVLNETITVAENVSKFKELLKSPASDTIIGMLQKFQENDLENFPVLNESEKVIVLIDEAHRGHYSSFGAHLNVALPNAPKIAFTGTPLMKDDKTQREFGDYIDQYTIEQAVEDGATVQIIYEGRESKTKITGEPLDVLFNNYFKDYTQGERDDIIRKYGKESAILEAPKRIEMIALDIINHFNGKIKPEGFKAQIVCTSRRAAVLYHEAFLRLGGPESAVIISGSHNDEAFFRPHTDDAKHKEQIKRFKKPMSEDSLSFLIVKDKLLTGFDAPVEQVMYLDRKLREHTLLQAIARVNRTKSGKEYGYIVDYYGLTDYLKEALEMFSAKDVQGALQPLKDEIPKLTARHTKVMEYFQGMNLADLDSCISSLKDERRRAEFEIDFKNFLKTMNGVLPDVGATPFISDMKKLGKINHGARNLFRDEQLNIVDVGEKVRKLINDHIMSEGVDPKIPPTKLFDGNFISSVNQHKEPKTQALEMEYAIKKHIEDKLEQNPEYYKALSKKLKDILESKHEKWEELVQLLLQFRDGMEKNLKAGAESFGLSEVEFAFFMTLQKEVLEKLPNKINDKKLEAEIIGCTTKLVQMLEVATTMVDFFNRDAEKREVMLNIRRAMDECSFCDVSEDKKMVASVTEEFMRLAEVKFRRV
jgi:type I restriction enzyme R subunit